MSLIDLLTLLCYSDPGHQEIHSILDSRGVAVLIRRHTSATHHIQSTAIKLIDDPNGIELDGDNRIA